MLKPQTGIACAGCPHRAAYVSVKEAMGRGRGRVYCGDAGCPVIGPIHPAALTCDGGEARLLPRYRQAVPSADAPASQVAHFVTDRALFADTASQELDHLAEEGATVLLCVLASSRTSLDADAPARLVARARELGAQDACVLDPFDTLGSMEAVGAALEQPGAHALIFISPCVQLMRATPEPAEVDRLACVGCHRCKQITGCPALSFTPPVYRIDPDACAGCDLCADFCRTHIIYSERQRMSLEERHAARMEACAR